MLSRPSLILNMSKYQNVEKSLADCERSHSLKASKHVRLSPKVRGEFGVPYHVDRRSRVSHGPESRCRKLQVLEDPVRAADMLTSDVVEGFGTRVTRRCCNSRGPVHHVDLTVEGMTTLVD